MHLPPYPNNVFFASQTQANESNIKFGIAFKLRGLGDRPCSSCMRCMGLELATRIAFIGYKLCLGKGFLRISAKSNKIKNGHPLCNISLWTIWIERNIKIFNHE